jgi:hypothetical protein
MAERIIYQDGFPWIPRSGRLWADYKSAAEYQGIRNEAAFRNYVCRHELRTIRHGRRKLVSKSDLDRLSGAGDGGTL